MGSNRNSEILDLQNKEEGSIFEINGSNCIENVNKYKEPYIIDIQSGILVKPIDLLEIKTPYFLKNINENIFPKENESQKETSMILEIENHQSDKKEEIAKDNPYKGHSQGANVNITQYYVRQSTNCYSSFIYWFILFYIFVIAFLMFYLFYSLIQDFSYSPLVYNDYVDGY
ncbi:hypothetical protein CWI38_1584p0020 [Hamiltosporidium tvaerminnensis]|uniref:Uncharacterized protein n=1 Tax=Hamiltosporidium tvaerminnensis TaxID=1176355 RepID=A0A4Q9LT22_9MICR|nr:hypothetical protein CWI38_1584p0020 [Hamiltosporidium tvaerminnensis]